MDELKIRYKLNQLGVFQNAPEEGGLYSLLDNSGVIVFMGHAENISQSLQNHLPRNEMNREIKSRARFFSFFVGAAPEKLSKLFDAFVKKHGHFPLAMKLPPHGSEFTEDPSLKGRFVQSTQEQVLEFRKDFKAGTATPAQLIKLARQNLSKGHAEKAMELLHRAKDEGNEDALLHLLLGHVLLLKGRQQAIQQWQKAASLDPRGRAGKKADELIKQYMRIIENQKF